MCLHGAQQSRPHYPSQSGRWMRAPQSSLSYRLTKEEEDVWGGSPQVWAAHSFCMSVSFHNSSAERDCQASLQLQRSIRTCHPAITTERWGPSIRIPLAPSAPAIPASSPVSQPAPCSGLKEIIKLYQQIRNSSRLPPNAATPPRLPVGYAAVLKPQWLALLFFSALSQFLSQMKYF